ncbi:MAG: DUF2062 domain-containing protein, partial [Planctomycetota bacterium]
MLEFFKEFKAYFDITKAEPRHVAMGAALAGFLGFVPLKCGLVALILLIVGMTNANGTIAVILGALLKPVSMYALDERAVQIGRSINESGFAKSHANIWNAPGVALLGLEKYHVMGGAILGAMTAVLFFIVFFKVQQVVRRVRETAVAKATEIKRKKAYEKALAEGAPPEAAATTADEAVAAKPAKAPGCIGKLLGAYATWRKIPLKKWVFLAAVIALFEFVIAKPMMRSILKEHFPDNLAKSLGMVDVDGNVVQRGKVEFDDASFDFSLIRGRFFITKLEVTNPKNPKENLFTAAEVEGKMSFAALLRRQVLVERIAVKDPQLAVARESDGSLGIEPKPPANSPPPPASSDWASKAKQYLERAKKEYDERQKKKAEEKKDDKGDKKPVEPAKKPASFAQMLERAQDGLPGENEDLLASKWVVKEVVLSGFSVNLQDPQNQAPSLSFNSGQVLEAAQNRIENGKATVLDLVGSLVDASKRVQGKLKLAFTQDAPDKADPSKPVGWKLHAELAEVNLSETDGLYADVIPLRFEKGTATLVVDATGHGLDGDLDAKPKIAFKEVVAKARRTDEKIGGMDAVKVAEEVTNCGEFELNDITITGCVLAPKVE